MESIDMEKFLDNVTQQEDGILFGELVHPNGKAIARYFMDFRHPWPAIGDDIDSYLTEFHDKYIVAKYFSEPGSLQWNYYLLIVSDEIDDLTKHKIESNKSYTRKVVLKSSELESYFDYIKDDGEQLDDIVEIWRSKLAEGDLDCVFTSETYTAGVPNYLSGAPTKANPSEDSSDSTNHGSIGPFKVQEIYMDSSYRPFPTQRGFQFGAVNLVRGVNGTGKTSVIEALEFAFCGRILRNPLENESNPGISVRFDGVNEMEAVDVNDRWRYRLRDREWYGYSTNAAKKQDRMQYHFNTFNLFSAEAAFRLSNSEGEFDRALEFLIAGPDAGVLAERIDGFLQRFLDSSRRLEKGINDLDDAISKGHTDLEGIGLEDDPFVRAFQNLKTFVAARFPTAPFPGEPNLNFEDFDGWVRRLEILMKNINEQSRGNENPTPTELASLLTGILDTTERCEDLSKQLEAIRKSIHEFTRESNFKENEILILNKALEYVQEKEISKIVDLKENLRKLAIQFDAGKKLKTEYHEIDWTLLKDQTVIFEELYINISEQVKEKRQEYGIVKEKIKKLREGLDALNTVRAEIKDLGGKFVHLHPEATECPLCNSPFPPSELRSRILSAIENVVDSIESTDLSQQLLGIENEGKLQKQLGDLLEKLGSIAASVLESNWRSISVSQIILNVENRLASNSQIGEEIELLRSLESRFTLKGFTSVGYQNMLRELAQVVVNGQPVEFRQEAILDHQLWLSTELERLRNSISTLQTNRLELDDQLSILITENRSFAEGNEGQDFIDAQKESARNLQTLIEHLDDLQGVFPERTFPFVQQLKLDLVEFDVNYSAFQKQRTLINETVQLRARIEAEIAKNTAELDLLRPQLGRAKTAVQILNDIKENYSLQAHLHEFLEANRKKMLEIFVEIHSPREFSDFQFQDNGAVQLFRNTQNKWVGLLEISTGQRAALALSIFLSMNLNLKKGPNILIFDDPVTFIDDLNILGFLDFLRKVALHQNRQIVFATASEKIGNLFEHKFDFLGEDFKVLNLERA